MKSLIRRVLSGLIVASLSLLAPLNLTAANATDLLPGLVPTLELSSTTNSSFNVKVTNYSTDYSWSIISSKGSINRSRLTTQSLFSITGLIVDDSATVTVTTTRAGYANGEATIVGYSNILGLTPTVLEVTPGYVGFSAQITNYTSDYNWFAASNHGQTEIQANGLIVVTGLISNETATVTVTTSRTGYSSASLVFSSASLTSNSALTPTLTVASESETEVTVQIENYDSAFTWEADTNGDGSASIDSSGLITITGLYGGQPVALTVNSTRYGYSPGTNQLEVQTLDYAKIPEGSVVEQTPDGFVIQIVNYESRYDWSASTSAGSVSINSSGEVRVTGLGPAESATVTIETTKTHTVSGSADFSGQAANGRFAPLLATPIMGDSGFTVQVSNYGQAYSWTVYTESLTGSASISDSGLVTVIGLESGQEATLHVIAQRSSYDDGEVVLTSNALALAYVPSIGESTSIAGGFTAQINNYDDSYIWVASIQGGSAVISNTGLIHVSGLAINTSASVVITAARIGFHTGSQTVTGQSLNGPTQEELEAEAARIQALDAAALTKFLTDYRKAIEAAKQAAEAARLDAQAKKIQQDTAAISSIVANPTTTLVSQIRRLTPDQVRLVPVSAFRQLTLKAIAALTPGQATSITGWQLKSLSTKQLLHLKPAVIGALRPESLAALSILKLKALSKAQVREIWLGQRLGLTAAQLNAIKR
jgi:hypothetical protein